MSNVPQTLNSKTSVSLIFFMGLLVVGIGCIFWAVLNIQTHTPAALPDEFAPRIEAPPSPASTPTPVIEPDIFKEGDRVGVLLIPALKTELPIIEGTRKDDLKKGVGHYTQSVLPGVDDNCVLSGHRDTVFSGLGKLKIGDILIAQTGYGTFTYEIKGTRIVDEDDRTVIVPTEHAVLTLTTCYPFNFVGSAPDRFIISADLVKTE